MWRYLVSLLLIACTDHTEALRLRVCVTTHTLHQTHRARMTQLAFNRISRAVSLTRATRMHVHIDRLSAGAYQTSLLMYDNSTLIHNLTMSTLSAQYAIEATILFIRTNAVNTPTVVQKMARGNALDSGAPLELV